MSTATAIPELVPGRVREVETATRRGGLDVRVAGLTKRFGDREVLRGVGFEVTRGETVALIGSNGAGKSSLLRCLLRLIEPDDGAVNLLGEDVLTLGRASLRRMRSRVGFVFQRHNLVPRLSALSNVVHGSLADGWACRRFHHAVAPAAARERAIECLDLVSMGPRALQRVDRLSGGESQRVAIARALMSEPELILADEPVASLDPTVGEDVMRLFNRLMRERGLTFVFTTHHLDHALAYADRVIGLQDGRITLDAPAAELDAARLRRVYG